MSERPRTLPFAGAEMAGRRLDLGVEGLGVKSGEVVEEQDAALRESAGMSLDRSLQYG